MKLKYFTDAGDFKGNMNPATGRRMVQDPGP